MAGENCRNLTGDLVEFSSIFGNQVKYEKKIFIEESEE